MLGLAVRQALLGRDKDHSGGQHVSGELCVVACAGVDIHVGDAQLFDCLADITDQGLVPVHGVAVPLILDLAAALCPLLACAVMDDCVDLLQQLGILMTDVDREVDEVRDNGVDAGMNHNFAGGVDQLGAVLSDHQLVDLLVQVQQALCGCIQSILTLVHGEGTCVCGLAVETQTGVEHTQNAVNNTNVQAGILQDGALLDVQLEHCLVLVGVQAVSLVALVTGSFQSLTESGGLVQNALGGQHVLVLEALGDVSGQVIEADNAGGHHCGRIQRTFLVGPDHSGQRMLVGDVLGSNSLQNFHSTHNAQDTVVVTAVTDGVAVRTHNDSLCVGIGAGQSCVHVGHVVSGDDSTDLGHSLDEVGTSLQGSLRQRIAGNTAVTSVTKGGKGMDLFAHSCNIALKHKRKPLSLNFQNKPAVTPFSKT